MSENKASPLLAALQVERLDTYLFRGFTPKPTMPRVFGGQVMAQAMNAAARTLDEGRELHSFHAYFIRPGNPEQPIIFDVDPIRDGRSFTTRRVVAKQDGKAIYNCSLSFMVPAEGFGHQQPMPPNSAPDDMESEQEYIERMSARYPGQFTTHALFPEWDIRWPRGFDPFRSGGEPVLETWLRFKSPVGDNPLLNQTLLAYASDFGLLAAASLPHSINPLDSRVQLASLDHGMWFHEPCDINQWLFYRAEGHWSGYGRGLNTGKLYQQDGTLVATTVQEGLMRVATT